MTIKRCGNSSGVLALGHVNNEDQLTRGNIAFGRAPRGLVERGAAVVGCKSEIDPVFSLDLRLGPLERRDQTGSHAENGYLHSFIVD